MRKGKYMALVLAAAVSLSIAGCGSNDSGSDVSRAGQETASSSQSDTSGSGESSSKEEASSLQTSETTSSSQSESTTTTTTAAESSTTSSTSQSSDSSSTSQSTTSTSGTAASTASPAATKAAVTTANNTTTTAAQKVNNNSVPTSGQWIGSVVVCDRNQGAKIRGLISFGGNESLARYFTSMVNDVKKMVGSGVNVYTMGAPVSSAFYTPKGMSGVTTDQHKAITDLSKTLRSDVKNIDTYAALAPHVNEYIYYRTDHHWTELAAYYAAQAFAKSAGVPFKPLSEYQAGVKQGFTGSMLTYSGCQEFKTYPDTYYYWKPKNSYTTTYYNGYFQNGQKSSLFLDWASGAGCYCTVLGSDMNLAEIKTDVKNGRTLVLIKDSYGNALVPYFVGSFEKIYVLDMRYTHVKLSTFFKQVGATDILFGSSLSSFYTTSRVDGIRALM